LADLKNGVVVEGVSYGKIIATPERQTGSNTWIDVTLFEGKNREIRKVMRHLGLDVNRLIRVGYGPFELGDLERGAVSEAAPRSFKQFID
ncbi:MAG: rRNA pseudouridine synthase, partial [Bdellovibrionales bacterium]